MPPQDANPTPSFGGLGFSKDDLGFMMIEGVLQDVKVGSFWDDTGNAVEGPITGVQLDPVPSRTSYWFSIVGALPDIELQKP